MTTSEIDRLSMPRAAAPVNVSQATHVEQARAVAEVAAAVRVAQENPRSVEKCVQRMRQACTQRGLAIRAFYSLPRAGGKIEGKTVHLARELAGCWGNVDYGLRELRRDDEAAESEIIAWAWDQETNTRASRSFIVPHAIMAGKGADKKRKALVDLADIANNNNSVGSRAQREVIFQVLPEWFTAEAEELAGRTLQDGGGKTLAQQVADMLGAFADKFGVTQAQLEDRLERPANDWTAQTVGFLQILGGELSRGEKTVEQEFPSARLAARSAASDVAAQVTPQPDTDPALDVSEPGFGGEQP